jgi:hypothetical protein
MKLCQKIFLLLIIQIFFFATNIFSQKEANLKKISYDSLYNQFSVTLIGNLGINKFNSLLGEKFSASISFGGGFGWFTLAKIILFGRINVIDWTYTDSIFIRTLYGQKVIKTHLGEADVFLGYNIYENRKLAFAPLIGLSTMEITPLG